MNRKIKIALIAAFVTSAVIGTGAVLADGRQCGPFAQDMRVVADKKLHTLHEQLQLNPSQETAWADFRNTVQAQASKAGERFRDGRAAPTATTAIERLERGQQRMAERKLALDEITSATRRFYATLDQTQQRRFDEATRQFGPERFGRHGHGPREGV